MNVILNYFLAAIIVFNSWVGSSRNIKHLNDNAINKSTSLFNLVKSAFLSADLLPELQDWQTSLSSVIDTLTHSRMSEKESVKAVPKHTGSTLAKARRQMDYGATLQCTDSHCSDPNPGIYVMENLTVTKTWTPTDWGTPEYFNFHIDCEDSTSGCTQKNVYYHSKLIYSWSSPYTRSPTQFVLMEAILSTAPDPYATGRINPPVPCGLPSSSKGSCTIETWGVLAGSKINPDEGINNHLYIRRHVGGFGIYDTESVNWTVEISFDPNLIGFYLPDDAICLDACNTNYVGDPVNTRSGIVTYPVKDIAIQTSAGELAFERKHISSRSLHYDLPLGYGWIHNLSPSLTFPMEPGGKPGMVLYKSPGGNIFQYWDTGVGTYIPYSGVKDILTENTGPPLTYSITEPDQTVFLFDASGKVTSRTTSNGQTWTYIYDAGGILDKVEADGGSHYLHLNYDIHGWLTSITDHTNRTVSYAQDASGNLASATDVMGQTWIYDYDDAHHLTEVIDPNLDSVVRNEYGSTTEYNPHLINFNNFSISVYSSHDGGYTKTIEDNGYTLHVVGHVWLMMTFPYVVTPNTMLEFDYMSTVQGSTHGIGMDDNGILLQGWWNEGWRCLKLWGTRVFGTTTYNNYANYTPTWHHYVIPLGNHFSGQEAYLTFFNDDDVAPNDANGYFRNVQVYESSGYEPIHFTSSSLTNYSNQDGTHSMSIEDDGLTLHLTGNTWKKTSVNYNVTPDTVIEFDFKSTIQGETHAIGFDTDNGLDEARTLKLYGTQTYGKPDLNNYSSFAPDWKHYILPIGQYYTGPQMYLYFGNDHDDIIPPTAVSYFSNVRIYENTLKFMNQYDGEDNLVIAMTFNPDGSTTLIDALDHVSTDSYNSAGVLASSEDALGNTTAKTYDANFLPASITDPATRTTFLAWSTDGLNLLSSSDPLSNQTDFTYDILNNLTSVTDASNHVTLFAYSGTRLTGVTDSLNKTTSYTYTAAGQVETVTDPLNRVTSFSYNDFGQRISMTDPELHTWTYSYDDLGRLVDTTDPLERVTHNEFDAAGRLTRITRNFDASRLQNDENQWNIVTEYGYDTRGRQTSMTDTYGHSTITTYDNAGRLLTTTDSDGNITSNSYNAAGQLVSTMDALNHSTCYEYDALGRVITVTDALNNHTHTSYNPDGTVATTTDALGKITSYSYDELGRSIAVTDPTGNHTHTSFDALGNIASTTDARGNITSYTYDALRRLTHMTDPMAGVKQTIYDDAGQQTQTLDARGNSTSFTYNDTGRMLTVTDGLGQITTYTYDALGRKISMTDARGGITNYVYDQLDRVINVTDPLGHGSTTTYDALGRVTARMDPNGNNTSYTYDLLGRELSEIDAGGGVIRFTYDAIGNRLTVTDANNHTTTTVYDALNRPVTVTDPNGYITTTAYDPVGNIISITDPLGRATSYTYDDLGRQITASDALGNTTETVYDEDGNRTRFIDGADGVTKYEYDSLGRLTVVVENFLPGFNPTVDINVRTEYTYDATGNRLTILDGNGHSTNSDYDNLDRQIQETDALSHTWQTVYDQVGNRASTTDAKNVTVAYIYDLAGRLILIDYPSPQTDTSFTYDDGGRRLTLTDSQGTTTWVYDDVGRIVSVTDPFNDTVTYAYDAAGNRTSLTYPDGKVINYSYDSADRLTTVTDWHAQDVRYTWSNANQLLSIDRPNGVDSSYTYDNAGRLVQIEHADNAGILARFAYTHDAIGNRTAVTESMHLGEPNESITTITYTYDPLNRLTAADYSDNSYFEYSYDAVGNRLTRVTEQGTTTYTYDDANRMIAVNGSSMTWDANGNLTDDGVNAYAYDADNRLTSLTAAAETSSYTYNGLGDRLSQTVNGVTTNYTLDLNAGLTQVLTDGEYSYLYGLSRLAQDAADREYFLGDALGSTRQLVNSNRSVTLEKSYTPFGNVLSSNGAGESVYGYTGEMTDESGLVYLRARYYEPIFGRFFTKDMISGDFTKPMSLAHWSYTNNNPFFYIDPSGHNPLLVILIFLFMVTGIPGDTGPYEIPEGNRILSESILRCADPADLLMTALYCHYETCDEWDVFFAITPIINGGMRNLPELKVKPGVIVDLSSPKIYKSFTSWNFRENLLILTGKFSDDIVGKEAHHVLPQKYEDRFLEAGININDPVYGSWVDIAAHRGWGAAYNNKWEAFLSKNPTKEEILIKAHDLAKEYNFDVYFNIP